MKKNFLKMMALTAVLGITLTACGDDNKGGGEEPTSSEVLTGNVKDAKTLDASKEYILGGTLIVEDGGTLTIPAGTTIKANKGYSNYILVLQGGKINVNGTAEKPVKITANATDAKAGHWGGLIINGKAKLSGDWTDAAVPTGSTEVSSTYSYGGNNDTDNSGSITYLILEYSGARSSESVEHNGLTLNGVGNGTKIENVYVYECADDGIEFFGGSVNVTNFFCVNTDDDMFDFTQGYTGTLTNAYGIWEKGFSSTERDPRGIEADGNLDGVNTSHTNQSDFTVTNVTFDLRLDASKEDGKYMHDVIKVRRGAKATITNALVTGKGQAKDLVDLKDDKGNGTATINLTNKLTTAISGKEITPADATGITISTDNKGCETSVFGWTKYQF